MSSLFLTATGTDCGKTWLCRGLARALSRRGLRVAALKPIETGVTTHAHDAHALAAAAGAPALATLPGLVRLAPATSPLLAARLTEASLPSVHDLADTVRRHLVGSDVALVEGAGGLLVPLEAPHTIADLIAALALPLALVGRDALGTLSHVLTAYESAERRALPVQAIVLTRGPWSRDATVGTNQALLAERLPVPVLLFPETRDDDDALADAAAPLLRPLGLLPSVP